MLLKHVKNPIKLAREMLVKGERNNGGGAGMHSQLSGDELERLAIEWGMEMVSQDYFFTQRRWDEHLRGLERQEQGTRPTPSLVTTAVPDRAEVQTRGDPHWDGQEYLPQGTVGAVVLDRSGTICVATSTGGLTNKLPGRIGDTPTLGAGFWAEEWESQSRSPGNAACQKSLMPMELISRGDIGGLITSCLPSLGIGNPSPSAARKSSMDTEVRHAVGMSGTGNGDSFLRVDAARTAAAMARFSPYTSLAQAVDTVAGPGGELEKSAGDRFGKTGEGEGGMIAIELLGSTGRIVQNHNCGGMFRAWMDDAGEHRFMVFKEEY
jgi:L-asparaginase